MKKIVKIVTLTIFFNLLSTTLLFSQNPGPPVGPGAPATPIDMYTIFLIAAAIVMLFIFAKKYKKQAA